MTERFANYELVRKLAQGGMAEVFLARFQGVEGFERQVVIKKMLPDLNARAEFVGMFLDEARLAARFNHPNIVQVHELGERDGTYFMAMEYVDGPHLGSLFAHSLRKGQPMPIALCAYVVARAAEGLHHAHEMKDQAGQPLGIVHRDVSPQNILVSRQGDVKIMDFGVAKAARQSNKTRTGVVKGKVGYMSPEQCLANPVDRRTDVFALGVVLYELVTRRRLFRDKSDLVVMQKITQEDVAPPQRVNKDVPEELGEIILRALRRDLDERTPDALTLSDELDGWMASLGAGAPARHTLRKWMEQHAADLVTASQSDSAQPTPSWGVPNSNGSPSTPAPDLVPTLTGPNAAAQLKRAPPAPAAKRVFDPEETIQVPEKPPVGLIAGAVVVVALCVGGAWFALKPEAPAPKPPVTMENPPPPKKDPAPPPPQQEAPRPAPTTGALRIMTDPAGATVVVNGKERGTTEDGKSLLVDELPVDEPADIEISLEGYDSWRNEVPIVAGETASLPVVKLKKATARRTQVRTQDRVKPEGKGKMTVDTSPYWTNVYVAGKLLGPTPIIGAEVPAGRVAVKLVRKDGCTIDVTRSIDVPANETVRKAFTIDAKDAKGSCQ